MTDNAAIDATVLDALKAIHGSTAHVLRHQVGQDRPTISKALQRLKRKGLVTCEGFYWQAVHQCKGNCQTWIGNSSTGRIQCADCGRARP